MNAYVIILAAITLCALSVPLDQINGNLISTHQSSEIESSEKSSVPTDNHIRQKRCRLFDEFLRFVGNTVHVVRQGVHDIFHGPPEDKTVNFDYRMQGH